MVTLNPYRRPCPYDIGDTLITENATDPAKRWPGTTWRKEEGVFLLGASDAYSVGTTGGQKEVKLDYINIPRMNVETAVSTTGGNGTYASVGTEWLWDGKSWLATGRTQCGQADGTAAAHENMPPYRAKYIWMRTA